MRARCARARTARPAPHLRPRPCPPRATGSVLGSGTASWRAARGTGGAGRRGWDAEWIDCAGRGELDPAFGWPENGRSLSAPTQGAPERERAGSRPAAAAARGRWRRQVYITVRCWRLRRAQRAQSTAAQRRSKCARSSQHPCCRHSLCPQVGVVPVTRKAYRLWAQQEEGSVFSTNHARARVCVACARPLEDTLQDASPDRKESAHAPTPPGDCGTHLNGRPRRQATRAALSCKRPLVVGCCFVVLENSRPCQLLVCL